MMILRLKGKFHWFCNNLGSRCYQVEQLNENCPGFILKIVLFYDLLNQEDCKLISHFILLPLIWA